MYEVVNQDGKSAGKVHVEDLKPFHEKAASEENSEGEKLKRVPRKLAKSAMPPPRVIARTPKLRRSRPTHDREVDRGKLAYW